MLLKILFFENLFCVKKFRVKNVLKQFVLTKLDPVDPAICIFYSTRVDISQIYYNNCLFVCFFFALNKKMKKKFFFEKRQSFWDVSNNFGNNCLLIILYI